MVVSPPQLLFVDGQHVGSCHFENPLALRICLLVAQAAERILAQEAADASQAAAEDAEGGGEAQGADALMEMGKLNTARIRKAVDPKILDVKKRVRAARRSLKRESKVVLSDEIIFFDDVAGNEQAKVGARCAFVDQGRSHHMSHMHVGACGKLPISWSRPVLV